MKLLKIITIIFVFDPLAVLLLIAANFSLKQRYGWDFESFADRHKKVEPQPTEVPKASGLKVGTAIISSRKKDPQVVVKEVESSLDVNKPSDVKDLEQKVVIKLFSLRSCQLFQITQNSQMHLK